MNMEQREAVIEAVAEAIIDIDIEMLTEEARHALCVQSLDDSARAEIAAYVSKLMNIAEDAVRRAQA